MAVSPVSSTTSATSASPNVAGGFTTQDFMALLIAQLQQQDPLNPMDPSEMVSQLSQLQSVVELTDINSQLSVLLSGRDNWGPVALLGRDITWEDDSGATRQGTVTQILRNSGSVSLVADDQALTWDQVTSVS